MTGRTDRVLEAHRLATGELLAWRCLVDDAGDVCAEEGIVEADPDNPDNAGAELHAHYLEAHYQPPPTRRGSTVPRG